MNSPIKQAGRGAEKQQGGMARYLYKRLSPEGDEIRVLKILPDRFEADVHIELSARCFNADSEASWSTEPSDAASEGSWPTIAFEELAENVYAYEALSYTWGDATDPALVFIQSDGWVGTLPVTRNCEDALRYLRYKGRPRTLWIDAICINQEDLDERARQVSIMRSIYSQASRVVVWLGPSVDNSDVAIEWINIVGKEITYDFGTGQLYPITKNTKRIDSANARLSTAELEAFVCLLERSYFDRLWVWQEVHMGGGNVKVRCGKKESTFQMVMTAVYYCSSKDLNDSDAARRLKKRIDFIQELPITTQWSSLQALDRTRPCKCKDQRDRIYTSLAFGNLYSGLQVRPDYTRPVRDVYTDFILTYLRVAVDLAFLKSIGDDSPHGEWTGLESLPSWVPDWSKRDTACRLGLGFVSGNSAASIVDVNDLRLTVRGVKVDRMRRVAQFGLDILSEPVTNERRHIAICRTLQTLLPDGADEAIGYQLVRVLTGDCFTEHFVPPRDGSAPLASFAEYVLHILRSTGPIEGTLGSYRQLRGFSDCHGRSLFFTEDRRIGLGPCAVRETDTLAVLLGCQHVVVLRPSSGDRNSYHVIGCALCTGLLDGEGILGSLPQQYETVQVYYSNTGCYHPAFRHVVSGDVTYEDPRLPPLSEEWKDATNEFIGCPLVYRNTSTQEVRQYTHDPRLDADALESRGVKLEEFCLV